MAWQIILCGVGGDWGGVPWWGDGLVALPPLRVGDADEVDALLRGDEWLEDNSMTVCLPFIGDCSGEPVEAEAAAAAKIEEVSVPHEGQDIRRNH